MKVLLTGAYGRCGTATIDHIRDDGEYDWTYLNRSDRSDDDPSGGFDTVVADTEEYDAVRPAFDGQDAVVHLAVDASVDEAKQGKRKTARLALR